MSTSILIVGAGAVGQVYGRHLQLGGAEVSFFVKAKYLNEVTQGMRMFPLNQRALRHDGTILQATRVLTTAQEVKSHRWDQVWLCISSPALRGNWLRELTAASGDATLITMTPGLDDLDIIIEHAGPDRSAQGMIPFISYQTPLEGDVPRPPGVAYWLPPLVPTLLSGPEERVRPVLQTLRRGGLRCRLSPNAARDSAFGSAVLIPAVAALEVADWSFAALRTGAALPLGMDAARQALGVVSAKYQRSPGLASWIATPAAIRLALRLSPWVVPLPLEPYLRYHFTKVGEQTRDMLRTWIHHAQGADLPHDRLVELLGALTTRPPH